MAVVKVYVVVLTAKNRRLYFYHLCCYLYFSENSDVNTGKTSF